MKQRNLSFLVTVFVGFAVLLSACGSNAAVVVEDPGADVADAQDRAATPDAEDPSADIVVGDNPVTTDVRAQLATYQSATVYAGATDFYFEDAEGNLVQFRVSNLPEDQEAELPNNLLEADVEEGPPGANPDLVGTEFLLTYDEQDQLVRVEPSN